LGARRRVCAAPSRSRKSAWTSARCSGGAETGVMRRIRSSRGGETAVAMRKRCVTFDPNATCTPAQAPVHRAPSPRRPGTALVTAAHADREKQAHPCVSPRSGAVGQRFESLCGALSILKRPDRGFVPVRGFGDREVRVPGGRDTERDISRDTEIGDTRSSPSDEREERRPASEGMITNARPPYVSRSLRKTIS